MPGLGARARARSLSYTQPSPDRDLGRSSGPRRRRLGTNSQNSVSQDTYYIAPMGLTFENFYLKVSANSQKSSAPVYLLYKATIY